MPAAKTSLRVMVTLVAASAASASPRDISRELFGTDFAWLGGGFVGRNPVVVQPLQAAGPPVTAFLSLSELPNASTPETLDVPCFNITLPFVGRIFTLVSPCGSGIVLPGEGITFHTVLGDYFVPGKDVMDDQLEKVDDAFSGYTVYFVAVCSGLAILKSISTNDKREAWVAYAKGVLSGALRAESDGLATDEQKAAKLNPNSPNFVCAPNIYRLIVVLNPNVVGFKDWTGYVIKAALCFYMQAFLPVNIILHCFKEWHPTGAKSPLWFAFNGLTFLTAFAALANVVNLFSARCVYEIEKTAMACCYLLNFKQPDNDEVGAVVEEVEAQEEAEEKGEKVPEEPPQGEEKEDSENVDAEKGEAGKGDGEDAAGGDAKGGEKGKEEEGGGVAAAASAATSAIPGASALGTLTSPLLSNGGEGAAEEVAEALKKATEIPEWMLNYLELACCFVCMLASILSSCLLQMCMFLKVATFQGDLVNIAIVAVSLYFIWELDVQVIDSDARAKPRYQRFVSLLKDPEPTEKVWPKRMASWAGAYLSFIQPFGLAVIVLVAWEKMEGDDAGFIIGGDPFH